MEERFYVNPYAPLVYADGRYFFQPNGTTRIMLPSDAEASVATLTDDAGCTMDQLRDHLSDDLVVDLFNNHVLVDEPLPIVGRSSRTDGFFALQGAAQAPTALQECRALVLGAGAIGSHVAWMLVSMGVRKIVLVDHDVVEESNLNRQVLYDSSDLGQSKVSALARHLQAINPGAAVDTIERYVDSPGALREIMEQTDSTLVVKALDTPLAMTSWVNSVCHELRVPYVQGGFVGVAGVVGPTYVPGLTPCDACYADHLSADARRVTGIGATLASLTEIVAGKVAAEAVRIVTQRKPALAGSLEVYDHGLNTSNVSHLPVVPQCATCGRKSPGEHRPPSAWPLVGIGVVSMGMPLLGTVPGWPIWATLLAVVAAVACTLALPPGPPRMIVAFSGGVVYAVADMMLTLRFNPALLGTQTEFGVGTVALTLLYLLVMVCVAAIIYVAVCVALDYADRGVRRLLRRLFRKHHRLAQGLLP